MTDRHTTDRQLQENFNTFAILSILSPVEDRINKKHDAVAADGVAAVKTAAETQGRLTR
jgi:hypothetical protein